MLNQVIYTRCSPHRELKQNGKVSFSSGFGVFSMSRELFGQLNATELDILGHSYSMKNGSNPLKEIGLFHSYEYKMMHPGCYAMTFEFSRPIGMDRGGNYVKQSLIGAPEGYPYEWFGAENWDACKKEESAYYLNSSAREEAPFLPQCDPRPKNGNITLDAIRRFVSDGRQDAVKAAVWFVQNEMKKPENERKVMLIRDTSENVQFWIAAIQRAFSPELAAQISFSTNISRLNAQPDAALFYCTDQAGNFRQFMNNPTQFTRHPYQLIAGFHPKDATCSVAKAFPNSNFVILEGVEKRAAFTTDASVPSAAYYRDLVLYDDNILDFCAEVLPCLNVHSFDCDFTTLYDAYRYLLDERHTGVTWSYSEAVRHLSALLGTGMPNRTDVAAYLVGECLKAYPNLEAEDRENGFRFAALAEKLASSIWQTSAIASAVLGQIRKYFLNFSSNESALIQIGRTLPGALSNASEKAILSAVFDDASLQSYRRQILSSSAELASSLLDLYLKKRSLCGEQLDKITENAIEYGFVCYTLLAMKDDHERLSRQIRQLSSSNKLLVSTAISCGNHLQKTDPKSAADWWDCFVTGAGGNLPDICRNICRSGMGNLDTIEQMLASRIRKDRACTKPLWQSLRESIKEMGANETTGTAFFGAWASVASAAEFPTMIRAIQAADLSRSVQQSLFSRLDLAIPLDGQWNEVSAAVSELLTWGRSMGMISVTGVTLAMVKTLESAKTEKVAEKTLKQHIPQRIKLTTRFVQSSLFTRFCNAAANLESGYVHFLALCTFWFEESESRQMYEFVDRYVLTVLQNKKSRQALYSLLVLSEALAYKYEVPDRTPEQLQQVRKYARRALVNRFAAYYKSNMVDKAAKSEEFDQPVRDLAVKVLQEIKNSGHATSPGGFFENLFHKK